MQEYLKFKKSNCKNCYKCIRHCPVKSIRFSAGQAYIIGDECILCGHCVVVCPQNAKQIADETEIVQVMLHDEAPVIASVAPSFAAYFDGVGFGALTEALKKLGFKGAEETAIGATLVKREYEKQLKSGAYDVLISSCCPSVNLLIRKYYPDLLPCLSPVLTPMAAHSQDIKKRFPEAKTVFIGPCLSKKAEAEECSIDAVLTFEEISSLFEKAGIVPEKDMDTRSDSRARLFPTDGGILKTMDLTEKQYTYLPVSGTDNCISALQDIQAGNVHKCFIEMSSCAGSCIGGPIMEKYKNTPVRHYQSVIKYAGKDDFDIPQAKEGEIEHAYTFIELNPYQPSEAEITATLQKMGKTKPEDELNCGTCGYNSCREKAIAVLQGKADISMCLPFLMDKTERFSNNILNNTPNGILVINEDFEIQQINQSAMEMLNIKQESDIQGEQLVRIFDPTPFVDVLYNDKIVKDKLDFYPEYKKYLELTIVSDKKSHIMIALLRDVTESEKARLKKEEVGKKTVEVADQVVDKQMRIVQEIASLLGETAAETKIALTNLKETISDEDK
jgi:iron only hydrogenase large subunit-like protein/uncharacterized Fe-S cluster-containing protein